MDARILAGSRVTGSTRVPGDKSIAHRWIVLASVAEGESLLRDLPPAMDVASSAAALGTLGGHPELVAWAERVQGQDEGQSSTWDGSHAWNYNHEVRVQGDGLDGLSGGPSLDCNNSGTTMRLSMGVLAGRPFSQELTGDASLSVRPMERVAIPLRLMGAVVLTTEGHAPVTVTGGGALHGVTYELPVASSQVKSAVLLAGLQAEGATTVIDTAGTRDHTERALAALGATVVLEGPATTVQASRFEGFEGSVPGDPSSASFLLAAAAVTGAELRVERVGLNPSRIGFVDIFRQMGMVIEVAEEGFEVGEPWGSMTLSAGTALRGVTIEAPDAARFIDEVPVLAALAAHAEGQSRFEGLDELRHKESDRLDGIATGLRGLGADVAIDGDTLVVAGGGLLGGRATPNGDHRLAMAFAVAALGGTEESVIQDIGCATVSFPGFAGLLRDLGAAMEPV